MKITLRGNQNSLSLNSFLPFMSQLLFEGSESHVGKKNIVLNRRKLNNVEKLRHRPRRV